MAVPKTTLWALEPHTKAKHLILRSYLEAWLPIMARHNGRIVFIDGFAGPGRYLGGDPGSPVIALQALLDHRHFQRKDRGVEVVFLFIEEDAERARSLREVLGELVRERPLPTWVTWELREEAFAPSLTGVLDQLDQQGARIAPTFGFIDPFGFSGLPLSVVARLLQNPHCECLINFSFDSINRFIASPNPKLAQHFDELFGTPDWKEIVGEVNPEARRERILELYRRQLTNVAKLRHIRTFEMVNEGNRTEYVLFFGTNSLDGLSKMKQSMWRVDPVSGQAFYDRSDPNQIVLLKVGGEAGLGPALHDQFSGRGFVPIADVDRFVLVDTPYSEKMHLRKKTLKLLEQAVPPVLEVRRRAGAPKRAGDYPSGTMVKFL